MRIFDVLLLILARRDAPLPSRLLDNKWFAPCASRGGVTPNINLEKDAPVDTFPREHNFFAIATTDDDSRTKRQSKVSTSARERFVHEEEGRITYESNVVIIINHNHRIIIIIIACRCSVREQKAITNVYSHNQEKKESCLWLKFKLTYINMLIRYTQRKAT